MTAPDFTGWREPWPLTPTLHQLTEPKSVVAVAASDRPVNSPHEPIVATSAGCGAAHSAGRQLPGRRCLRFSEVIDGPVSRDSWQAQDRDWLNDGNTRRL